MRTVIDGVEFPAIGAFFEDRAGRLLRVEEIRPNDPQGRNVVGVVRVRVPAPKGSRERNEIQESAYACDLLTFQIIWKPT